MYKIASYGYFGNIIIRRLIIDRTKSTQKQHLVFLRAPKHFNIGKQKVHSFNSYDSYCLKIKPTPFLHDNESQQMLFKKINECFITEYTGHINSYKITYTLKIKW